MANEGQIYHQGHWGSLEKATWPGLTGQLLAFAVSLAEHCLLSCGDVDSWCQVEVLMYLTYSRTCIVSPPFLEVMKQEPKVVWSHTRIQFLLKTAIGWKTVGRIRLVGFTRGLYLDTVPNVIR